MKPVELHPYELMQIVADFFEAHGIHYRVVGSLASMAYGEPRFTNDVDIVADLPLDKVATLCAAFPPPEYYVSEAAARAAVERRFQFNILHIPSGLKADVIMTKDTDFGRLERERIRRVSSPGEYDAWFGSPEDVVLNKLLFYQMGEIGKHLRDIASMMLVEPWQIDRDYMAEWAAKLGVQEEWKLVQGQIDEQLQERRRAKGERDADGGAANG